MKFFIDTANIDEIKEINSWGILSGVTTNPTLIAKEGKVFEDVISEIAKIVPGPVSAEVISTNSQGMIKEAIKLKDIGDNVIIKIPMTEEGLKAVSFLSKNGIKTNVTLVFSVSQAILAARAGATYISPFLGRLDDIGVNSKELIGNISKIPMTEEGLKAVSFLSKNGIKTNVTLVFSVSQAILAARAGATYISPFLGRLDDIGVNSKELIGNISKIFEIYDIKTKIIAASIRTPNNILDSLLAGCDIATVPYKVFKQMVKHPLTDNGLDKFLNDFINVKTKGDF